jgi:hypothetical protein
MISFHWHSGSLSRHPHHNKKILIEAVELISRKNQLHQNKIKTLVLGKLQQLKKSSKIFESGFVD